MNGRSSHFAVCLWPSSDPDCSASGVAKCGSSPESSEVDRRRGFDSRRLHHRPSLAALVVPGVFDDEGVLFGVAFLVVCVMHVALYALAGRRNRNLLGAVLRLAPWPLLGASLILVAGFADGTRAPGSGSPLPRAPTLASR
jgi:hypothetical protein